VNVNLLDSVPRYGGWRLAARTVAVAIRYGCGCDTVRRPAAGRIADLDSRIDHLVAMREGLRRLADTCDRPRREQDCPLLNALDSEVDELDGPGP
jgi:hypothetical protein